MLPDVPWPVYAFVLAPVALTVFATLYKYLEVRAARDWPSAPGRVVISEPEMRSVKVMDSKREEGHRFEERNFANVPYEYMIAGQKYRNDRVTIGEDRGNFEVAETLARYPVGAVRRDPGADRFRRDAGAAITFAVIASEAIHSST